MTMPLFSLVARRGGLAGLAALSVALVVMPARAGNLDRALLKSGVDVLQILHKRGYRNVGVLPFTVTKGQRKASLSAAPLSFTLPTRLENVLIMWQDPRGKTIGVVRDAAATSGLSGPPSTRAEFDKLFEQDYPLAWGKQKVKVDAFLTGIVQNVGDRSRTSVTIQYFDKTSWKNGKLVLRKMSPFHAETDRALLSDLGYPWKMPSGVKRRGLKDLDRRVVKMVARADAEAAMEEKEEVAATPDDVGGFKLEVFYDGVKQKMTLHDVGDKAAMPVYRLPPMPKSVERITMKLTRRDRSEQVLGVVLKVNGQSTNDRQTREDVLCRKWLYGPEKVGKADLYEGFYMSDPKSDKLSVHRFKRLSEAEFRDGGGKGGERLGWIDLKVFADAPPPKKIKKKADPEEEDLPLISTRSTVSRATDRDMGKLQASLKRVNNLRLDPIRIPLDRDTPIKRRAVIDADLMPYRLQAAQQGDRLRNPQLVGSISILYRDRD